MVNVLRGEMNLIGPRPHPTSNQKIFLEYIAYYGLRSTVRPGVTGWAQVRYGYANNLEQETEKMRYDLYYIKNHTLWLDLKILFETVFIMVTGHGATEVRRQVRREEAVRMRASLGPPERGCRVRVPCAAAAQGSPVGVPGVAAQAVEP
jgi:Bacterial sugar transferase